MKEHCLIKSFKDVNKLAKLLKNQIRKYGSFVLTFEFEEKELKKTLHDRIEERTPDLPFAEARRGLQMLVHDIRNYCTKHPEGRAVRTLSVAQIIILVMLLVGAIITTIWITTKLLPW